MDITCNARVRISTIFIFWNTYSFSVVGLLVDLCVYVCFYEWGLKPRPCAFSALSQPLRGNPAPSPLFLVLCKTYGGLCSLHCALGSPIWLTVLGNVFLRPSIHSLFTPFCIWVTTVVLSIPLKPLMASRMPKIMGAFPSICGFFYSTSIYVAVNGQILPQWLLLISRLLVAWMSGPLSTKRCTSVSLLLMALGADTPLLQTFCLRIQDVLHSLLQIAPFSPCLFLLSKWLNRAPKSSAVFFCPFVLVL